MKKFETIAKAAETMTLEEILSNVTSISPVHEELTAITEEERKALATSLYSKKEVTMVNAFNDIKKAFESNKTVSVMLDTNYSSSNYVKKGAVNLNYISVVYNSNAKRAIQISISDLRTGTFDICVSSEKRNREKFLEHSEAEFLVKEKKVKNSVTYIVSKKMPYENLVKDVKLALAILAEK